jgi:hypothetical protein
VLCEQQVWGLGAERVKRRIHRVCRAVERAPDGRHHIPGLGPQMGHQPADPLGREVAVGDDLVAPQLKLLVDVLGQRGVLGVAEKDQRLLDHVKVAGVDQHVRRRREPLGTPLALQPAQGGMERGRA